MQIKAVGGTVREGGISVGGGAWGPAGWRDARLRGGAMLIEWSGRGEWMVGAWLC